MKVITETCRAH